MSDLKKLIELLVEQEFKTKFDEPIEFKIYEESPQEKDNPGRGWIVHLIEAYIEGEKVGYIKVSYIPEKRFRQHYKSVVQYIGKIKGRGVSPGKEYDCPYPCSDHFEELPLAGQVRALARLDYSTHNMFYQRYNESEVKQPEEMSKEELLGLKNKMLGDLEDQYRSQFEKFMNFHVDNPLVDYIHVEEPYRRRRIAVALYEKAARWLAETKGLKLFASGLQRDEAKAAWEWLKRNKGARIGTEKFDWDGESKTRTYLSYL